MRAHDGASHHGRLGRPVASQHRSRLVEAVSWVSCSWPSPRSVGRSSSAPLWGAVGVVLRRWRCHCRGRSARPTASTTAPGSARACTTSGLRMDAKGHQVRDAVLQTTPKVRWGRPVGQGSVLTGGFFFRRFGAGGRLWRTQPAGRPLRVHRAEVRLGWLQGTTNGHSGVGFRCLSAIWCCCRCHRSWAAIEVELRFPVSFVSAVVSPALQ